MKSETKRHIIFLCAAIALVGFFTQLFPHSFDHPVVPDEKAYYQWALLYSEGKFAVPLEDWYDAFAVKEVYFNQTSLCSISLNYSVLEDHGMFLLAGNAVIGIPSSLPIRFYRLGEPQTPPKLLLETNTSVNGDFSIRELKRGNYLLEVAYFNASWFPPINLFHREIVSLGTPIPYHFSLSVISKTQLQNSASLELKNSDMLGNPVQNAIVNVARKQPHGLVPVANARTDTNGCATVVFNQPGSYVVIANKSGAGKGAMCSVVEKEGHLYAVNHWPPGYSLILAAFLKLGIANCIGVFFLALCAFAIYIAGRRLFGAEVGFYGALLQVFCGIGIMLVFEKGMADYATTALAFAGFAMLLEAIRGQHRTIVSVLLAFLGGLAMGFSVLVRYSSVVLFLAPLALALHFLYKQYKCEACIRKGIHTFLKPFLPFALGTMILALCIANYNATHFGSPFNSGYQYPPGFVVVQSTDGNYTPGVSEPDSSMFESYFSPSLASLYNLPNILKYLFVVMPVFFLFPIGLWIYRKNPDTWWLFLYALPLLIIYMQLSWVSSWDDPSRCIEDTRYFLPALPALSLLTALGFLNLRENASHKCWLDLTVGVLALSGFLVSYSGIALALWRTKTQVGGVVQPGTAEQYFLPAVIAGCLNLAILLLWYGLAVLRTKKSS
ncbi:MAG: hypothetical protein QXU48_05760 [Thermoplasmata archaeon]